MIITNKQINSIVNGIEKINGKDIVRDWEPQFNLGASNLLTIGSLCKAVATCYRKVAKNENAKNALAVVIDRLKVHVSAFVRACTSDIELLSAAGELNSQLDGDFKPLEESVEKAVAAFEDAANEFDAQTSDEYKISEAYDNLR